ncbi:ankyrin repeat domain-containing protein [Rhabdochlamydiaceae symbiont of Dictyostelium giganteum]|uniref:ankyrin repeat domain-containing protein n=1 Tax=Rhabdochlamydiaceae symbiont of Dictyostelium giganteum TaxID=3342349 RepID=UPI00384ECB40
MIPSSSIWPQHNPSEPTSLKASGAFTPSSPIKSLPHSELRCAAIHSIQKEGMRSLMKTCGFDDAWIQEVKEENFQSQEHLVTYLFSHILHEMKPEEWDKLSYPHLLELYDLQGMNIAFTAIREGKKPFFSYLIHHVPVDDLIMIKGLEEREELRGKTLLHLIAIYGREEMLQALLHTHLDMINMKDKDALGLTALHWAIHEGHEEILRRLLSYGMIGQELELKTHIISLIALAILSGYPSILALLLSHNQFKEISLLEGIPELKTPLHLAIHSNQPRMLTHLLNHEHDTVKYLLELKDALGRTPLQLAAFLGDLFAIRALIHKGAHIHQGEFEKGGTALHFAVRGKQPDATLLLLSLGIDPSKTDAAGRSPLADLQDKDAKAPLMRRCKNILENFTASKRLDKVKETLILERAPFNMILEGSYLHMEGFIGVIEGLESKKILKDIRRFSGLGMGSMIATLLSLGYTSSQLRDLPFTSLQELLTVDHTLQHEELKELEAFECSQGFTGKNKVSSLALCHMKPLQETLEEIIYQQSEIHDMTFKELADKIQKFPERYKHIHLFTYSLTQEKLMHVTSENAEYEDFVISDVLTAALSFPGVLSPLILRRKNSSKDLYDDTTYGKVIAPSFINSLVDQFDELIYQENPYFKGKQTNYRTLVLKLTHLTVKKDKLTREERLLLRLLYQHLGQGEKREISEEISRGRIKEISFLGEDHKSESNQQIEQLFSEVKAFDVHKTSLGISRSSKPLLKPWKYDFFLQSTSKALEDGLIKPPSCLSNIPVRDHIFVGRVKELEELKTAFLASSRVSISGLGGMGKSTLSFKYALELKEYLFLHLIKVTGPRSIKLGLLELALLLGLKKEDHEETLTELKVTLKKMTLPGLIVIDGLDDSLFFQEIDDYLPNSMQCHILITTRIGEEAKVNGFHDISLTEFSEEEALCYLIQKKQVNKVEQESASCLAKEVGYHPLALSHIVRYLQEEDLSIEEYSKRFKSRSLKLPDLDAISLPAGEQSVFITWQVSLEAIKQKKNGELSLKIMHFIALLGEEDIPFDLLCTFIQRRYPEEDPVSIASGLKLLKNYAFLQETRGVKKYYHIHALVQKVIAHELREEDKKEIIQDVITSLDQEITELRRPYHIVEGEIDDRLREIYQVHMLALFIDMGPLIPLKETVQLLSHLGWIAYYEEKEENALWYIDQGITLIKDLSDQPFSLLKAELYHLRSCIESDEELARESLAIREKLCGVSSEYTVESCETLAFILGTMNEHEEALSLAREVLHRKKAALGDVDGILRDYENVINILKKLKKYEEALTLSSDMLMTQNRILGVSDHEISAGYASKNVIELLQILGRDEEALIKAQALLKRREESLEESRYLLLESYQLVITLLVKLERTQEALDAAQKMIAIKQRHAGDTVGDKRSLIQQSYQLVMTLLCKLNRKEEAVKLFHALKEALHSHQPLDSPLKK